MSDNKVSFYDLAQTDALARELKIDPQCVRRARNAYFKKSIGVNHSLEEIPVQHRQTFADQTAYAPLNMVRHYRSSNGEAEKLISRTDRGFLIESVILRPATGRISLCISSQIGCAASCSFCATGSMGVARNLKGREIAHQITLANEQIRPEGRRVRNLVFMGMGEPFHNEESVIEALNILQHPAAFHYSPSRILVSTVGIPDAMVRTASLFKTTNFALSLHSADQHTREQIVPLARKYCLHDLREAVTQINAMQPPKKTVMIEYIMLQGINDSSRDAEALVDWIKGLRVHVNLIPYNPISSSSYLRSSSRSVIEDFGAVIRASGVATTIRHSLGTDIEAACGQLVRNENRKIALSQDATLSIRN